MPLNEQNQEDAFALDGEWAKLQLRAERLQRDMQKLEQRMFHAMQDVDPDVALNGEFSGDTPSWMKPVACRFLSEEAVTASVSMESGVLQEIVRIRESLAMLAAGTVTLPASMQQALQTPRKKARPRTAFDDIAIAIAEGDMRRGAARGGRFNFGDHVTTPDGEGCVEGLEHDRYAVRHWHTGMVGSYTYSQLKASDYDPEQRNG